MGSYVARSPGLKCRLCGKDISYRVGTDVCLECRKKLDKQKETEKRKHIKALIARDTVITRSIKTMESKETGQPKDYAICPVCNGVLNIQDAFCRYCGQRLLTEEEIRRCHKK